MDFNSFMYRLLNSGAAPHPGIGGGMPNALAAVGQPAPTMNALSDPGMASPMAAQAQGAIPAPQQAPAPQSAPQGNGGGFLAGLGNMVQGLVDPQSRGRNETVSWLQSQGLDQGTATLLAGNKPALQKFLLDRTQGGQPDYGFMNIDGTLVRTDKATGQIAPLGQFGRDEPAPRPMTPTERLKWGIPQDDKRPYSMTEDGPKLIGGGGVNVDARQMGTVPPGYRAEYDANGQVLQLVPIPGGPAAAEAEAARKAAEAGKTAQDRTANIVVQDIDRTLGIVKDNPNLTTGIGGMALSNVPGTDAFNASKLLNTVKANAGFDKLQAMRDASPTGGALGQVSEREIDFLQSTIGNLEQSQSAEQFTDNLKRVKNAYLDIIYGPGNGPEREKLGFQAAPDEPTGPLDFSSEADIGAAIQGGTIKDGDIVILNGKQLRVNVE